MTEQEQRIEREQVVWVFGLTGGELSDKPWTFVHESYGMSTDPDNEHMPRDDKGRTTDPNHAPTRSFRYHYDGAPEWTTDHTGRGGTTDSQGRDVRTAVHYGMPPAILWDVNDGARWERVAFYQSSGESECPGRDDTDGPTTTDGVGKVMRKHAQLTPKHRGWTTAGGKHYAPRRAECPLCEERVGSAHGFIYLGEGWGEAVYVRVTPMIEWEIRDHGVEHAQYFQGCGVSFTKFTDVITGIGTSAREAAEDALEQMSTSTAVDNIPPTLEDAVRELSNAPSFDVDDPEISPEWHHYASIRWRVVKH